MTTEELLSIGRIRNIDFEALIIFTGIALLVVLLWFFVSNRK